jgi:hypothetical protein
MCDTPTENCLTVGEKRPAGRIPCSESPDLSLLIRGEPEEKGGMYIGKWKSKVV